MKQKLTHNERLKALRDASGLTRAELEEISGINQNTIYGYENGRRIPVEAWEALSKACKDRIRKNSKLLRV